MQKITYNAACKNRLFMLSNTGPVYGMTDKTTATTSCWCYVVLGYQNPLLYHLFQVMCVTQKSNVLTWLSSLFSIFMTWVINIALLNQMPR